MSATPAPKIIVAVHGIGEQTAYETAQSVAFRVFGHYDVPPALPLGRFHRAAPAVRNVKTPGVVMLGDAMHPAPGHLGFAEMYWADVPRQLVKDGYTLEEAKRWARTIIARLNLSAQQAHRAQQQGGASGAPPPMTRRQYLMLQMVLDEMVDAVFVLDNLTFLADRAGIFKFNLKQLLDDFLNDVQVVTDFQGKRVAILNRFHALMGEILRQQPNAELYIVGHSEGSVVAFLGLLDGVSKQARYPWVGRVRGLMTIGSPIEIHRLLWEGETDMWPKAPEAVRPPAKQPPPIQWWNYYDTGDPIAYRLDSTRAWLVQSGWNRHFLLPVEQDVEFARYPLAGKAHVDYWKDDDVFGHFIETVVLPTGKTRPLPRSKELARAASVAVPYLVVLALMFVGVFALYKPVTAVMGARLSGLAMARDLSGFTLLLLGMTMVVRAPRLTQVRVSWVVWLVAAALFSFALWAYDPPGDDVTPLVTASTSAAIERALAPVAAWLPAGYDGWAFRILVVVTTLASAVWSTLKPARGVRPLMVTGGALTALLAFSLVRSNGARGADSPDVWPVVLGGLFFLYLWWLATLILDLTIVWHTYVRWSAAMKSMRNMMVPGWSTTHGGTDTTRG